MFCSTWDITDFNGEPITIGFVSRVLQEDQDDGSERLICRAMNWRSVREDPAVPHDYLAQRILDGLARPGAHRCLIDLKNWTLLKWLDDPVPFFDWRASMAGDHVVHSEDRGQMAKMAAEFGTGTASGVLRMKANGGGWTPVHVTVNRIQLEEDIYAGLATLRVPTDQEIAAAGFEDIDDAQASTRKTKPTLMTTSRSSTTHWATAALMARANADACEQAAPVPAPTRIAAATAARSAAACARWRAITADPTYTPPMVIASNTAIIATATRLAEPCSPRAGFGRGDRLRRDGDARQQRRVRGDPGDNELAIAPQPHGGPFGRNALRCTGCRTVITTRREPSGLPRGVDATHLHRHRGEP